MDIQTNIVFRHLKNSKKFITVEQGGSRSGKTFNILLWLIMESFKGKYEFDVVRKTLPSLKATALKDFVEILDKLGIWESLTKIGKEEYLLIQQTILKKKFPRINFDKQWDMQHLQDEGIL